MSGALNLEAAVGRCVLALWLGVLALGRVLGYSRGGGRRSFLV